MCVCVCVIVCLVLFPSKLHTLIKHSQFYIKFDETYLLGINSSVFFLFLLVLNRLFFCSNMYKGSVFSFLCSACFLPLFAGVSLSLSLSLSLFLVVVIVVVVFISTALRLLFTLPARNLLSFLHPFFVLLL